MEFCCQSPVVDMGTKNPAARGFRANVEVRLGSAVDILAAQHID